MTIIAAGDKLMRDLDSATQWDHSNTWQYYPDLEQNASNCGVRQSNPGFQPLKAVHHGLEEHSASIHNDSRVTELPALDQFALKMEYWPQEQPQYTENVCVSDVLSNLCVELPYHPSRIHFTETPCPSAISSVVDVNSLAQDLSTPELLSNLEREQKYSNPWPSEAAAADSYLAFGSQHIPGINFQDGGIQGRANVQPFSFTSWQGVVDQVSSDRASQNIQQSQLSSAFHPTIVQTCGLLQDEPNTILPECEIQLEANLLRLKNSSETKRAKTRCVSGDFSSCPVRQKTPSTRQITPRRKKGEKSPMQRPAISKRQASPTDLILHGAALLSNPSRSGSDEDEPKAAAKARRSFQIVHEDGQGNSTASSSQTMPIARARRQGPLSANGRRDAALRRKDRSVCIWCRLSKKKCSGQNPCGACVKQAKSMIVEQPCVKADFFQIVEAGTCNYISQRAVNHLTLDGSSRRRMELPSVLNIDQFVDLLEKRRGKFNIRVRQAWGTLFVLDLEESWSYVKCLQGKQGSNVYDLQDFIDNHILKLNNWQRCVKECNPVDDMLSLLSQWNTMPSRASYDFVFEDSKIPDRPMNIEHPGDQLEILLAAHLSRIVCRKLEVDGYRNLQYVLNKNKWDDMSSVAFVRLVSQLGHILVSLRWRVSWWELLGDGGMKPDINKERYQERVQSLCKILYFYFTSVKLKLPSWIAPGEFDGVWSTYADARQVWDDFPSMATAEGFEAWMARGKELIREAGVRNSIPTI
ncbi:hypothetical protein LOZ53_002402 [Ophidiomyces ophidiicola]|nr:hypothetical protein LOZ55_004849 [Ophidiomyces ophidiicola]KAI1986674.1 hypothetical protein LOZ54_003795 [Ophidiomyces ophidiicola]KAI1992602.1 hypothetical protein LOZ53_002402 [Ophidiomyces ophidiicola]KAI1999168.1 hypothetical protein LOZ51_001654 [Ophidiomyces ophidiicola]